MGLSGKYDFKGIKKAGAAGLRLAFSASPTTAWLVKFPSLTNFILEFLMNWLANKGLVLLNVGANYIEGELDQKQMDNALDKAFSEIKIAGGRDKLTAAQIKEMDDATIKAARELIVINKPR